MRVCSQRWDTRSTSIEDGEMREVRLIRLGITPHHEVDEQMRSLQQQRIDEEIHSMESTERRSEQAEVCGRETAKGQFSWVTSC